MIQPATGNGNGANSAFGTAFSNEIAEGISQAQAMASAAEVDADTSTSVEPSSLHIYDSSGLLVGSDALRAVYGNNGTYLGSYGIDPSTGKFAAWDADGQEQPIEALASAPAGATPFALGESPILYNASGDVTGYEISGYLGTENLLPGQETTGAASDVIYNASGQAVGSIGFDEDQDAFEVWTSDGSESDATQWLQSQGLSATASAVTAVLTGSVPDTTELENEQSTIESSLESLLFEENGAPVGGSNGLMDVYGASGALEGSFAYDLADNSGFNVSNASGALEANPQAYLEALGISSLAVQWVGGEYTQVVEASQSVPLFSPAENQAAEQDGSSIDAALAAYILNDDQQAPPNYVSALSSAQLQDVWDELTPSDIAYASPDALSGLTPYVFGTSPAALISALGENAVGLTQSQIGGIAARASQIGNLGLLSNTALAALTTSQLARLSASQIEQFSGAQQQLLLQSGALTEAQVGPPINTSALTAQQVAALSSTELSAFTTSQWDGLDVSELSTSQIAGMSSYAALDDPTLENLKTAGLLPAMGSLATLAPGTLQNITPDVLATFSPAQLSTLTASQVGGMYDYNTFELDAAQVAALSPSVIGALSGSALSTISPSAISGLTAPQIAALSSNIAGLSAAQIGALTPQQLGAFTAKEVSVLMSAQLSGLTQTQVASLNAAGFTGTQLDEMSSAQFAAITPQQIAELDSDTLAQVLGDLSASQTNAIFASQIEGLASDGYNLLAALQNFGSLSEPALQALSQAQLSSVSASQLQQLAGSEINTLTPAEIGWLTPLQAESLSTDQLAALSNASLGGLTSAQLNAFSALQTGALSAEQIAALNPAQIGGASQAFVELLSGPQAVALTPTQLAAFGSAQAAALYANGAPAFNYAQVAALPAWSTATPISSNAAVTTIIAEAQFDSQGNILQVARGVVNTQGGLSSSIVPVLAGVPAVTSSTSTSSSTIPSTTTASAYISSLSDSQLLAMIGQYSQTLLDAIPSAPEPGQFTGLEAALTKVQSFVAEAQSDPTSPQAGQTLAAIQQSSAETANDAGWTQAENDVGATVAIGLTVAAIAALVIGAPLTMAVVAALSADLAITGLAIYLIDPNLKLPFNPGAALGAAVGTAFGPTGIVAGGLLGGFAQAAGDQPYVTAVNTTSTYLSNMDGSGSTFAGSTTYIQYSDGSCWVYTSDANGNPTGSQYLTPQQFQQMLQSQSSDAPLQVADASELDDGDIFADTGAYEDAGDGDDGGGGDGGRGHPILD